jgi:hypothetical protein
MQVVVDCKTWRRGGGAQDGVSLTEQFGLTCLLNSKGYKCCLGFAALQLGYTEEEILDVRGPGGLPRPGNILCTENGQRTDFSEEAMSTNDNSLISDQQRMEKLQQIGEEHGVEFEFINQPEEGK